MIGFLRTDRMVRKRVCFFSSKDLEPSLTFLVFSQETRMSSQYLDRTNQVDHLYRQASRIFHWLLQVKVKWKQRLKNSSVKAVSTYVAKVKKCWKIVGLIDPINLCTIFVSPRQRAYKTFHLLFENVPKTPHHVLTEEVREWDYGALLECLETIFCPIYVNVGDFEGLLTSEILERSPGWDGWKDG